MNVLIMFSLVLLDKFFMVFLVFNGYSDCCCRLILFDVFVFLVRVGCLLINCCCRKILVFLVLMCRFFFGIVFRLVYLVVILFIVNVFSVFLGDNGLE